MLTLQDCQLQDLFGKADKRASGLMAELHAHAEPLRELFTAYAVDAPATKRKSAPIRLVLPYDAFARLAAERQLPKKAVKASTDPIYAKSESVESSPGLRPSQVPRTALPPPPPPVSTNTISTITSSSGSSSSSSSSSSSCRATCSSPSSSAAWCASL